MSEKNTIDQDSLIVHQSDRHDQPLNAEVKGEEIIQNLITPTPKIFHRNHDDLVQIPKTESSSSKIVEDEWKVGISVERDLLNQPEIGTWSPNPMMITYGEILSSKGKCDGVDQIQATATLECAGNRRSDLNEKDSTEGIQWSSGAISTAHWYGISIRDLLLHQGLHDPYGHHSDLQALTPSESLIKQDCAEWAQSLHLHMLSAQPTSESDQPTGEFFGASIPLPIIMHPAQKCILATHQNDQILTQSHGFPIRAVIPGHVGARWVKWLNGLRISTQPENSPPMRLDYKILKPPQNSTQKEKEEWEEKISGENRAEKMRKQELDKQEPIQSLGVGSSIEQPKDGEILQLDSDNGIKVRGYAVGQDGSPITKVEVAVLHQNTEDETRSELRNRAEAIEENHWTEAILENDVDLKKEQQGQPISWAWSLWEADVKIPSDFLASKPGSKLVIVARATTSSGVKQEKESPWNLRGFSTRSWPVVKGLKGRG